MSDIPLHTWWKVIEIFIFPNKQTFHAALFSVVILSLLLFKKGCFQFLAKECVQVLVNYLED